jgi:hypothetical protein
MASEDSDQFTSRLAVIHRLRDFCDLDEAGHREVPARAADIDASRKAFEVVPLRRAQRMRPKERDHDIEELVPSAHDESVQVLLVVVVPSVDRDGADSEEVPQLVEAVDATCALDDHEAVGHLVAGSIAAPASPVGLFDEADGETAFPTYESDHPADPDQPFLLVFRTYRIVTAHTYSLGRVPVGYSGFPAYSRMLTVTLL